MTSFDVDSARGSLQRRFFPPRGVLPEHVQARHARYAEMPVPVIVRNHILRAEAMFERVRDTTHPDFTWAWSLLPDCMIPENPLGLDSFELFDKPSLEALEALLTPDGPSSPLTGCHHGTTIEIRFTSFELRQAVCRFGASGVLYAMLDFQQFFWEAFESAVPDMVPTVPVLGPVAPLVISSYCADRDRLRDPMGFVGVDFHLPGIGVVASGSDAGRYVELSGWHFHPNCLSLEETVREQFIGMLVENDRQ